MDGSPDSITPLPTTGDGKERGPWAGPAPSLAELIPEKPESKAARLALLESMGFGPRPCKTCATVFTPPPYTEFKEADLCEPCCDKAFVEWAMSAEGQAHFAEVNKHLMEERGRADDPEAASIVHVKQESSAPEIS